MVGAPKISLKQVVRCLHKLWMYAKNLAYARSGSSGISGSVDASESDEAWRQVEPDNAYPSIGLAACNRGVALSFFPIDDNCRIFLWILLRLF